jgi:recombinational DNA repair protein RecR
MSKIRDWIQDWILGNDYCRGCKYLYSDQYGNMCENPERQRQILTRNPQTHKSTCNLWRAGDSRSVD